MKTFTLRFPIQVKGYFDAIITAETEEEAIASFWAEDQWLTPCNNPTVFKIEDVDPKYVGDPILINTNEFYTSNKENK